MRVTFVSPVGVLGGGEKVLLAALRALPAALPGFAPTVVLLADGPLAAAVTALGARAIVCPLPDRLAGVGDTQLRAGGRLKRVVRLGSTLASAGPGLAAFLARLRRVLAAARPQLIHSNGLKSHLLLALARPAGVPVTWHLHDTVGERPVARRLLPLAARRGVRGAVAVSEFVRQDALGVLPRLPVTTVHNAVDTHHFAPGDGGGPALDRLAGLSPAETGVVRVGLVATYADWKGHAVFLRALAGCPGVRGFVVGGPIYRTAGSQVTRGELVSLAAALGVAGRVGFVPFQPDPVGVYPALDIVVHASTRPEPFGLTIAEAMSCGRPVVVAAAGGAAELVTPGVDALTHTPSDAVGLAAAINLLAGDAGLCARLGAAARATAVARFGLARFGAELAGVFRDAVTEHGAKAHR